MLRDLLKIFKYVITALFDCPKKLSNHKPMLFLGQSYLSRYSVYYSIMRENMLSVSVFKWLFNFEW